MSDNTIKQIKNAEADAQRQIGTAREKAEQASLATNETGEKTLAGAEDQATEGISQILEQAKKDINNLKIKNERDLTTKSQQIANIDNKAIDKAANTVVKQIMK